MKKVNRLLSLVLALVMLIGCIPLSALATDKDDLTFVFGTGNDTYYSVTKNNAPLRKQSNDSGKVITRLAKGELVKVTRTFRTWKLTKWYEISYLDENGRTCTAYLYSENAIKYSSKVNEMRNYAAALYDRNGLFGYWGITKKQAMDLATTASSKTTVDKLLMNQLKARLEKAVGKSMDVSGYKTKTYYSYVDSAGTYRKNWGLYQKSGGCTWYAFNRFREINDFDLMFKGAGGGNAKTWDDRIMTDDFTKIKASALSNGTMNAVGVDNEGSGGYGHVIYIELVADGYVYYSHGWYKNGVFTSRVVKVALSEFPKTFETVIMPK